MCCSAFITISLCALAGIEKVSQRVMARRQSLRHDANSNYLLNRNCFARFPLTFAAVAGRRRSRHLHAFRAEREKNLPAIDQSIEYLAVARTLHHFLSLPLPPSALSLCSIQFYQFTLISHNYQSGMIQHFHVRLTQSTLLPNSP